MADEKKKTIAFVLYPGLTLLDLAGPLQVITTLAGFDQGFEVVVVAERIEPLETDTPLTVRASHTFAEVPAPYVVVVPGGGAPTLRALTDETLLSYLRGTAETARWMTSVCTGALLLGAAGLLGGKRANTHWTFREGLRAFGATPVDERWVEDGQVITAAGVAAGSTWRCTWSPSWRATTSPGPSSSASSTTRSRRTGRSTGPRLPAS